ncbi:MAG: hypothetical protein OEZ38_11070, partial [Gammaproteobacteria bacterium]|nr:hypothetical protein [Gammaproteobacteria bacterium]
MDVTTQVLQDGVNKNIFYVGTRGGFYRSLDKGNTWQNKRNGLPKKEKFSLSGSIGGIAVSPFENVIYLGMGYRPSYIGSTTVRRLKWVPYIYKSYNQGESWEKIKAFNENARIYQLLHSPFDKDTVFAATSTGLYQTTNAGSSWIKILDKPTYNILLFKDDKSLILASCGGEGVLKSSDYGVTWSEKNKGLSFFQFKKTFRNRYSVLASNPSSLNQVFIVNSTWGRSGGLYKSDDKGESWEKISEDMPESWLKTSRRMNAVTVHPDRPGMLFLGSSRYLYRSKDSGRSWEQLISKKKDKGWTHTGINVFGHTRAILVDRDDKQRWYIGTSDHGLTVSYNAGISWQKIPTISKRASYVRGMYMCSYGNKELIALTNGNDQELCLITTKNKGKSWVEYCGEIGKSNGYDVLGVDPVNCNNIYIGLGNGLLKSV